jgi:hypothetical protein
MTSGALLVVQPARAAPGAGADPPVVASLAVTGPADCAGRADVVKLVARRSGRIRFDDGTGAASGPALRVAVEAASPRTVAASLSIVWPEGARSERHLSAPTCAEVADAIALVVVLALDPAAASREPPAPAVPRAGAPRTETPPPARSRERVASQPAAETRAPDPAPAESAATTPPPPPDAPSVVEARIAPPPARAPSPPPVYRWDIGGAFRVAGGPAPSLMPGLALVAGWERDTASAVTLKVELIAAHYSRDTATFDGTARVMLDLVTLRLCPLRAGAESARARFCASGSAGRTFAEGTDTLVTRSRSRPFASVGGAASLAVSPRPRLEVTATVEPQVALIRDTYSFGANVFYDVPALALFVGVGAAMTFQ